MRQRATRSQKKRDGRRWRKEQGREGGRDVENHEIERMRMWCRRVGTLGEIKLMKTREGGTITRASSIESNVEHTCEREVKTKGDGRGEGEEGGKEKGHTCQERAHT